MPHCDCNKFLEKFQQFRHKLYAIIPNRRDAVMDLLDALSSNRTARSPVELSLNPLFRRDYSVLYKAIEQFNFNPDDTSGTAEGAGSPEDVERLKKKPSLQQVIAEIIPTPVQRPFYLFGLDVTPIPRPYAQTLEERLLMAAFQTPDVKHEDALGSTHPFGLHSIVGSARISSTSASSRGNVI